MSLALWVHRIEVVNMFGLFRNKEHKKAADRIGVEIHRQLLEALKEDESRTSKNLSSSFTPGYLYGFIRFGLIWQGFEDAKLPDKYLKHICDGVLPKILHEIFNKQFSAVKLAKDLGNQEEIDSFEIGINVGVYDSGVFSLHEYNEANNFYNYLTEKELKYTPIPEYDD